jgi:hypothetical protein
MAIIMNKKKFKTSTVILTTISPTLILSIVFFVNTLLFINESTLITGQIVEVNEKSLVKTKYSYSIEYQDSNNTKQVYTTRFIHNDKIEIGKEIEIYYNKKNEVKINTIGSLYKEAIATVSIGASFFIITIILLV